MTVNSTTNKVQGLGNGSVGPYAITFPFELAADIVVIVTDVASGVDLPVQPTYAITGGAGDVGNVTFNTTIPSSQRYTFRRVVSASQLTSYPESSPFPAKSHEKALDKLTYAVQQLAEAQARAITLSPSTTVATTPTLADPIAGSLLGWDATGTTITNYLATSTALTPVSAYWATVLIQPTAAASRGLLGSTVTGDALFTAASAAAARTTLGLGTIATQSASAVAITGGTVAGVAISTSTIDSATTGVTQAAGDVSTKLATQAAFGLGGNGATRVLLSTQTASNSALLGFTVPSGYDTYELEYTNLVGASSGGFGVNYSVNAGAGYLTTGYQFAGVNCTTGAATAGAGSAAGGNVPLASGGVATTGGIGITGELFMHGLADSSVLKLSTNRSIYWDGTVYRHEPSGAAQGTAGQVVNFLKISNTGGNILTGKASLYGYRNS